MSIKSIIPSFSTRQCYIDYVSTHPRGGRCSFVSRLLARPHLIHPCTAVIHVSAEDEARLEVDADLVVEPFVDHVLVDAAPRIPLSKLEPLVQKLGRG